MVNNMRRGFSLLELVISIVVMGIVFLSIPTIIMQNAKNNTSAIIQQSVMDTKTHMALILKTPWGCVNDPSLMGKPTPIFNGDPANNFYTKNLIGENDRRNFSNISKNEACLSSEKNIDFFDKKEAYVEFATKSYSRDNIVKASLKSEVGTMTNDNIKIIKINTIVAQTNPNTNIILTAYSANIGDSPKILKKSW
ncbi:type IV pilus modification PilV family protein [Campylobacter sp. RM16192]|uniref:type IV pilus modification PilV family protein n=1 Tax=Campylobacter sp. RM16192 TaxID=1660080 RepID=UPI0014527256|nr:type II secretion system protein [Campylobacter sp. RM16192]QCD52911.1 hypothetical protein CDOMC_1305 [Campylobacter sp. RM16192]